MKLGSETASVMNHLHSRATIGQPVPAVGMGVTFLHWTDRHPGTIVTVFCKVDEDGEPMRDQVVMFVAQEDHAKRVDSNGMSECQAYEYTPNPNSPHKAYRQDKNGCWRQSERNPSGRWVFLDRSQEIRLGSREKYHDFSF